MVEMPIDEVLNEEEYKYVVSFPEQNRLSRRVVVKLTNGCYAIQETRKAHGNRIFQTFRNKLGISSSEPTENLEKKQGKILKAIGNEYALVADGIIEVQNDYPKVIKLLEERNGIFGDYSEIQLMLQYQDLIATEKAAMDNLKKIAYKFPLHKHCNQFIHGIGGIISAIIIACVDMNKVKYVSNIWGYAGLDVVNYDDKGQYDNRGRGKYKSHLVPKTYTKSNGEVVDTTGIRYNPWFRMKMLNLVPDCFVKSQNLHYLGIMNNYKFRLMNDPNRKGIITCRDDKIVRYFPDSDTYTTDQIPQYLIDRYAEKEKDIIEYPMSRIINMGKRYIVKIFLADQYEAMCLLMGRKPKNPYFETKFGLDKHTQMKWINGNVILCDYKTGQPIDFKKGGTYIPAPEENINVDPADDFIEMVKVIDAPGMKPKAKRGGKTSKVVAAKAAKETSKANMIIW